MRKIFTAFVFLLSLPAIAQVTYLPQGSSEELLLDRLETCSGKLSDTLFLSQKPISRKDVADFLYNEKTNSYHRELTNVDNYNINRAISISSEWADNNAVRSFTNKPLLNTFYFNPADFIQVNKKGFFLSINPVLSAEGVYQNNGVKNYLFNSAQGLTIRAKIANVVGLNFNITNNYTQPVNYYESYINKYDAMPGAAGFRHLTGGGYQYLLVNGYADIAVIKDHLHITAGYDKHFLGDGMRSLFLSDFSAAMPFVAIHTKVWKLDYENLYMAAVPQFPSDPALSGGEYKYITSHHLSANITRWLNIGLFEAITFSRDGHFEIGYMNPIIFYRSIEHGMGSPDKAAIGINAKVIAVKSLQLYGQFLLNEFTAKEFFSNHGYMHNKWGAQLGFKYFNAFTLDNLDIQGELNMVRPYTYEHYSEANYSNFNLPIAHPLGAGFIEFSSNIRYQPIPKLDINAHAMYYQEGVDTGGENFGNEVTRSYRQAESKYGVRMINGVSAQCMLFGINASYEIWPNLFFDLGATYRKYTTELESLGLNNSTGFVNAGFRLNIARRSYWEF